MRNIFQNAISEFRQYRNEGVFNKLEHWKRLTVGGKYDLVKNKSLLKSKEGFDEKFLRNNGNEILIDGKWYNLGEVSNILVGFNAHNIGYSLETLNLGGLLFVYDNKITNSGNSNGFKGEYYDRFLYSEGYDLAIKTNKKGGKVKMNDFIKTIEKGTSMREKNMNNPDFLDNYVINVNRVNSTFLKGFRKLYELGGSLLNN